jgi:transposase InsO family protein
MTDNGPAYRSIVHAALCRRLGIRHIFTRPYRPRTNGKVERLIQTLLREWAYAAAYPTSAARTRALTGYLDWYNTTRPHKSLDGKPPAQRLAERINAAASDS